MTSPLLSFILATHRREEDAIEAIDSVLKQNYEPLEVVVVVSPSGDSYATLDGEFGEDERVRLLREQERRGPPAARNWAFEVAEGDIFVSLDDDAVFRDDDAASTIVHHFQGDSSLGILALRSEDYYTGDVIAHEIPIGPRGRDPDRSHPTTYFVGVGAAFRADAVSKTEGFSESFYYQMEELDFSFQILKQGYTARYCPDIVVRHKHAEAGRPSERERWSRLLDNRLRVAIRHLPWWCFISSAIVWTALTLWETRGSLRIVFDAYRRIRRDWDELVSQREVIDTPTRREISNLNGRIWY